MMDKDTLFLLGASGHAKVISDIAQQCGYHIEGVFDDNDTIKSFSGFKNYGNIQESEFQKGSYIISIGNNAIRKKIAESLSHKYLKLIHPNTSIDKSVAIGEGTVIMASASVNADSVIGQHVIINTSSSIDHDCKIDDYVHISPNATLSGDVHVGEGTHIGAGATVIQGKRIGKWCTIGAGAVVITDVPDGTVYTGVPAKLLIKTKKENLIIIGAGGLGKEVKSLLNTFPYSFLGFIDDNTNLGGVISNVDDLKKLHENALHVIAIGSSKLRKSIYKRLPKDIEFTSLIHPSVIMQDVESVSYGCGNIICTGSIFTCNIKMGNFCVVNLNCTIGHDVIIGDFCSLMPSVNISGNVTIEDEVFIGTGATVLPGITIGKGAVIGAGSVVTKNVLPNTTVVGIPAK